MEKYDLNTDYSPDEIKTMMKEQISTIRELVAPDDILNIANSMLEELAGYEEYEKEVKELLDSDKNPMNFAEDSHDEMVMMLEGIEGPLSRIDGLPMIVYQAAIKQTSADFAMMAIDIIKDDSECVLAALGAFLEMVMTSFGTVSVSPNFDSNMEKLSDIVYGGFDVDMMDMDVEEPPESLDRGEPVEVSGAMIEDCDVGRDTSVALGILKRLSLKTEDYDSLAKLVEEKDDHGVPKYSTTEIVKKAQEIMEKY
jgi:hypothetical protein